MASSTSRNRRLAVADAVHSAAIHLLRGVRKEDERTGVGPARLSALSVLVFAGPMRLTELARIEQVKPPTMTKVIAGLEAALSICDCPQVVSLDALLPPDDLLRLALSSVVEASGTSIPEPGV